MHQTLANLFEALGSVREVAPGAVGLGSVTVPGSRKVIQQLIEYARHDNTIASPIGRLTLTAVSLVPGTTSRILLSGQADGDPVTYAPKVEQRIVDLFQGHDVTFGGISIQGQMGLPEISVNPSGEVLVTFSHPLTVRKVIDPDVGRFRHRMAERLTAQLIALRINPVFGTPLLSGLANWLAPQLEWAD